MRQHCTTHAHDTCSLVLKSHIVLAGVTGQQEPVKLIFNNPNGTLGDNVKPDEWKDYFVVAPNDDRCAWLRVV